MSLENNLIKLDGISCPSCNGKLVSDMDKAEQVCSNCGMVLDQHFDNVNPENPNFFTTEMENENFKEPISSMMYEIGLPTFIDMKNVDASGKKIPGFSDLEKLRRLNKFTISNDSKTRNLNKAVREIRRMTEILGISSSIAERASYIYRKALGRKLIRGRSITGIVAATIYIACKDAGILFPLERIENLTENCNRKNVVHYYKLLLRQMKMNVGIPDPAQHVSRIAARARLSGKAERKALEVLSRIEGEPSLSGKKPVSVAAASLYLAALQVGEYTTQLRVAIASELTTVTIRKRYLEIDQILKQRAEQANIFPAKDTEELIPITQKSGNEIDALKITI